MTEDLQRIGRYVSGLARRERMLISAKMAANGVALAVVVGVFLQVAAWLRWDRSTALGSLILFAGVAAWWVFALPLLTRWRPAGDRQRQARLVETLVPELRGRLLTAVGRLGEASGRESEALVGLVARRSVTAIEKIPPARVHPARFVVVRALLVLVATFLVLPLSFVVTGGPLDAWRWWAGEASARVAVEQAVAALEERHARVGDLSIRYTYPPYTGLEPRVVENSTGDVAGPPGTQVQVGARTGDPVEAAGLVAYEQRLDAEVQEGGREVEARFTIQAGEGTYRLDLYRGGEPEASRDFMISSEQDLPPNVTLDAGGARVEIAVNEPLVLQWAAADDYGIATAALLVDERAVVQLPVPEGRRAEVMGGHETTPRGLGLRAGDSVKLVVEAWDNDTWSGSKPGRSRVVEVVVLGANGVERRSAARQEELVRLMVPVLADMLTDAWPPGDGSGAIAAWGESLGARYEPLIVLMNDLVKDGEGLETRLLSKVVESGQALIRYTQVAFEPEATEVPSRESLATAGDLRSDAVVELESALVTLIRMKRNRALGDLMERARRADALSAELEKMFETEDPDALALLARLDQLEQLVSELMQAASQLGQQGLQEFVNSRGTELSNLMEEIRQAIADGDLEEAQELMKRLAQQLDELSGGIEENMAQSRGEANESMEAAEELIDELTQLEREQRELQGDVQELRAQQDASSREEAAELWAEIGAEIEALERGGRAWQEGVVAAERAFHEVQRAEAAMEDTSRLAESAAARDLRGSQSALQSTEYSWDLVYRSAISAELTGRGGGPRAVDVIELRRHTERIGELLAQLEELSSRTDPATQERSQQLESRQRELDNRLQEARQAAEELSEDFPVEPRGLEESLDDADARMKQAGDDLGQGRPMEAEGSQGVAAERLREAREAVQQARDQAAREAQQLNQPGQRGQQQGEQSEGGRRGDQVDQSRNIPIPSREEFRTPEEYRRALLEGMEGDVPEQYRALKRRYYEELVHQ